MQSIAAAAPDVQVELILAANQRHFAAATPILLQTAQSAAAPVRLESIKALRAVADDARLSDLVELLLQAPGANERTELEKTITAVALQAPPEKRKSEVVMARLRALPAGTNVEARESLLKILGGIGDQAALPLLLAALSDTTAPVKTAAIVALTDWPTPEPGKNLLAIAENSRHALHQVLALRGFVRSLRFESEQPTADTIKKFQHAMELAANPHEQKMVLGWLAEVKSLLALELAVSYLKNEVLQPEAEVAAVKIAGAMSGSHPAEVKTLLQQVLQSARNDTLPHIKEARAMLEQIER
ncbi:MAG: hypothetical protein ALAOOOJD_03420 [bacterium]|nr:hypothetical protein [bacterium]